MILIHETTKHQFDLYTDIKEAAEALGMDRATLRKRLEKYPTFYFDNFVIVTNDLRVHKSRKGGLRKKKGTE